MMHQLNVEEAKSNLPELIDAAINGEEIVIAKDDQHLVKLVPVSRTKPHPQFGSAKGLISMSDDFDKPLEDLRITGDETAARYAYFHLVRHGQPDS